MTRSNFGHSFSYHASKRLLADIFLSAVLSAVASAALGLWVVLAPAVIAAQSLQAPTFRVLHSFIGGTDGEYPSSGLIRDASGNLYGTTTNGWESGCVVIAHTCGVVFEVDQDGEETVLYRFAPEGAPYEGLVRDAAGNLYGTTDRGGMFAYGTVFKLDMAGTLTVLYRFTGGKDGSGPSSSLIRDAVGNLYGTTGTGGNTLIVASGAGVVFKLDTSGKETVLYSFTGGKDGGEPVGKLVRDLNGNLYGTTVYGGSGPGGSGHGVVFKLDTSGKAIVLHTFTGGTDGGHPNSGVIRDTAGNLYGGASDGGSVGAGVVFKLNTSGKETVLHNFTWGKDGGEPSGVLVRDTYGNLYGTATAGGIGWGVVFQLDTSGKETVLYSFTGGQDGLGPAGGLARDTAGNLYGTTTRGGSSNRGVVFMLTP